MALKKRKRRATRKNQQVKEPAYIPPQTEQQEKRRFSIGSIWKLLVSIVRYALIGGLALLCVGVFFVAVIMGEAPELGQEEAETSAVLEDPAPLPGTGEFASQDIAVLTSYFPGPLAQISSDSGIAVQQGTVQDLVVDGVTCRVISLRYQVGEDSVTLRSATPAAFLKRYATADVMLSSSAVALGSVPGMSLQSGNTMVVTARQGTLLYALEAPLGFSELEQLAAWVTFE